tara:strand:+ start:260 stop:508 length:249 start_codon:yes stop_codon:yes gene_type:complete
MQFNTVKLMRNSFALTVIPILLKIETIGKKSLPLYRREIKVTKYLSRMAKSFISGKSSQIGRLFCKTVLMRQSMEDIKTSSI